MAKTNRKSKGQRAQKPAKSAKKDAIALLKADHREVEGWFAQIKKTRSAERKQNLASRICSALRVHTTIEEEIFYPAFLEATKDKDLHHEAEVEHAGSKKLIEEMSEPWQPEQYHDTYRGDLMKRIQQKVKARQTKTLTEPEPATDTERRLDTGKVVDLMAQLRKSLDQRQQGGTLAARSHRRSTRRRTSRARVERRA